MYEQELREILAYYRYGLEVHEFAKHDRINVFPTNGGIHKMRLDLRCHLNDVTAADLLKHILQTAQYKDWQSWPIPDRVIYDTDDWEIGKIISKDGQTHYKIITKGPACKGGLKFRYGLKLLSNEAKETEAGKQ